MPVGHTVTFIGVQVRTIDFIAPLLSTDQHVKEIVMELRPLSTVELTLDDMTLRVERHHKTEFEHVCTTINSANSALEANANWGFDDTVKVAKVVLAFAALFWTLATQSSQFALEKLEDGGMW